MGTGILALHPRYSRTTTPEAAAESPRQLLLAEPAELTRMGVHRMLEWAAPKAAVTSVGSWWAAEQLIEQSPPTVLLLSSELEGEPGSGLVQRLRSAGTMVVLLVHSLDRRRLRAFLRLPIGGVLVEHDLSVATLSQVLSGLDRGVVSMPWEATRQLLELASSEPASSEPVPQLTGRELDTLSSLAQGLTNRQIARRLGITEHGVKRHVANLLAKLQAANRTMAVTNALRLGLIESTTAVAGQAG
jgi:two-component system, NarL family, nitrate/nitrite response regulator NarL